MLLTRPFLAVGLTLTLLLTAAVGCGGSEETAVPDALPTTTQNESAKESTPMSNETVVIRSTASQSPTAAPETESPAGTQSPQTLTSGQSVTETPVPAAEIPKTSPSISAIFTPTPATARESAGSTTHVINLSEQSPDVDTPEMELARDYLVRNVSDDCWSEIDDPRARRWCLGIDDVSTVKAAAIRRHDMVQSEPANVNIFALDSNALVPPLVGQDTRFDLVMRDGYNVFNLRQFNAPVLLSDSPLAVAVPPVLDTSSWDKFLDLLSVNQLIPPDDVYVEQWVQELDHYFQHNQDHHYPIVEDDPTYDYKWEWRQRNPHIDVMVDSAASPFSDDLNRFIVRLSALQVDPVHEKTCRRDLCAGPYCFNGYRFKARTGEGSSRQDHQALRHRCSDGRGFRAATNFLRRRD